MRDLKVATWNVHRRRECLYEAFADDTVDVLAAQEVPAGGRKKDAPGSPGHGKIWGGGRAVLSINKRWDRTEWAPIVIEKDVVAARVGDTHVFSIYSEGFSTSWKTPIDTLLGMAPPPKPIVAGDFNLHHPLWDKEERTGPGIEKLLELAVAWDLTCDPEGRADVGVPRPEQSTLDLIWFGTGTSTRYEGAADWAGSDHYPQLVTVRSGAQPQRSKKRPDWSLMRRDEVAAGAEKALSGRF